VASNGWVKGYLNGVSTKFVQCSVHWRSLFFLIIISAPIRLGIVAVSAILLLSYLNFFGSVGLTLFDLGMIKEAGKRDALSTSLFKNTRADEYAGKCPNQRVVKRNPDTASYIDKKQ
jgi:hypothetical protein